MNSKLFLATIAGAVLSFLLGWLVYGLLLMSFLEANTVHYEGLMMEMPNMFLIGLANLASAFFLAYVFQRWAGFRTFLKGLYGGLLVGFLMALSYDLYSLSMMNLYNISATVVDIIANTVNTGIVGGLIAWILGTGKQGTVPA